MSYHTEPSVFTQEQYDALQTNQPLLDCLTSSQNNLPVNASYADAKAHMEGLISLYLFGDNLVDLTPVSSLYNIHDTLSITGVRLTDISPLAGLKPQGWVTITGTSIADISAVSGFESINMSLSGNRISDLTPLKNTSYMYYQTLNLSNNLIADVTPLENVQCDEIWFAGNQICDFSPIEHHGTFHQYYGTSIQDQDCQDPEVRIMKLEEQIVTLKALVDTLTAKLRSDAAMLSVTNKLTKQIEILDKSTLLNTVRVEFLEHKNKQASKYFLGLQISTRKLRDHYLTSNPFVSLRFSLMRWRFNDLKNLFGNIVG